MNNIESNKNIVQRFNKEVIEQGNISSFNELMDSKFINRSAPPTSNDSASMWHTFNNILRPAFPDLKVEIYEQIAEGDKVTTRKAIVGTHLGNLLNIPATNKKIKIDVIDIVRIQNAKYAEHWGINNFQSVIEELRKASETSDAV
ncbi:MAG: ester cyclase [Anaerolineales bacterium]